MNSKLIAWDNVTEGEVYTESQLVKCGLTYAIVGKYTKIVKEQCISLIE